MAKYNISIIYNSRNLYKVLNMRVIKFKIVIYNSRNLYKVLNSLTINKEIKSTIVEIYIRY